MIILSAALAILLILSTVVRESMIESFQLYNSMLAVHPHVSSYQQASKISSSEKSCMRYKDRGSVAVLKRNQRLSVNPQQKLTTSHTLCSEELCVGQRCELCLRNEAWDFFSEVGRQRPAEAIDRQHPQDPSVMG